MDNFDASIYEKISNEVLYFEDLNILEWLYTEFKILPNINNINSVPCMEIAQWVIRQRYYYK